jgi:glycerol-3-phosphate dehydrogenase
MRSWDRQLSGPDPVSQTHTVDLLIVGGGINGAGIARDAAGRGLRASESIRLDHGPAGAALKPGFIHGFSYPDCSVDDSRLVVLNVLDAALRGAVILTRTRLQRAQAGGDGWRATCVDVSTGRTIDVRARALINAAGSWVEPVRRGCPICAM